MSLIMRSAADGIEFVNGTGLAVAGIKSDGTVWGKEEVAAAPVSASAPDPVSAPVAPDPVSAPVAPDPAPAPPAAPDPIPAPVAPAPDPVPAPVPAAPSPAAIGKASDLISGIAVLNALVDALRAKGVIE